MRNEIFKKILILGIISLFIGIGITQIVPGNEIHLSNSTSYHMESVRELRNIMLTGYWNPTGQMIAQFSTDPYLNPDGWKGENWEDSGYNIYSYFPTPYLYNGTFEVDYQDTLEDFEIITDEIKPIAIISFGAGIGPWEIEFNARNLDSWINDEKPPHQPTPCPPDDSVPVNFVRHSTLPVQAIADAVDDQTNIKAWVDWNGDPGRYLCEYMAYLGMWYQDRHNTTDDPYRCWEAGFIHVRDNIALSDAIEATIITIREVIKSIPNFPPIKPTINGPKYGNVGIEYPYTFVTTDPDGDDVFYWIDWGDGSPVVEWNGPYESGQVLTINHAFLTEGKINISAQAKDVLKRESEWGYFEVEMPRTSFRFNNLKNVIFNRFTGIFPIIKILLQQF